MLAENDAKKYKQFYDTTLGKQILQQELQFINEKLTDKKTILSVGCGPAIVETELQKLLPEATIIGLDNSKEIITQAPREISLLIGDASHLSFKDNYFDAVLYVTSLEFIKNSKKTIQETYRVLRKKGVLLVLMLNPRSQYFQERYTLPTSYIRQNVKHMDIKEIKQVIAEYFQIKNEEYFLGIMAQGIVDSKNQRIASLYVFRGEKR